MITPLTKNPGLFSDNLSADCFELFGGRCEADAHELDTEFDSRRDLLRGFYLGLRLLGSRDQVVIGDVDGFTYRPASLSDEVFVTRLPHDDVFQVRFFESDSVYPHPTMVARRGRGVKRTSNRAV